MAMSEAYVEKLQLPQMVTKNTDNHETAFTVSIDCVDTTTTLGAHLPKHRLVELAGEGPLHADDVRRRKPRVDALRYSTCLLYTSRCV